MCRGASHRHKCPVEAVKGWRPPPLPSRRGGDASASEDMEDYGLDVRHGLSFPLPVPLFPPLCRFLWWNGVKETREPHYDCRVPHSFEVDGGGLREETERDV